MNRYPKNSTFRRFDGKRVHRTTTYPNIPLSNSDVYIITSETDFLDGLAEKYYRDPTLWWIIAQANQIAGTIHPGVGRQLRIPMNYQAILSRFQSANSI